MSISHTSSAGAGALDPTALRLDLGDASVIRVAPADLHATLAKLKAEGFSVLVDIGGADYLERVPRYDVVYHLIKLRANMTSVAAVGQPERVRVLCGVDGATPRVPSVCDLWPNANWPEREVFDLFGITFDGHPDLRRIQLPADWEGHPLRKDYPLRGPAREAAPRPSFALKSNVMAGTPVAGKTAAALQRHIAAARGQALPTEPAKESGA
jgi:NADH-quinone oxidoreductase subunit C